MARSHSFAASPVTKSGFVSGPVGCGSLSLIGRLWPGTPSSRRSFVGFGFRPRLAMLPLLEVNELHPVIVAAFGEFEVGPADELVRLERPVIDEMVPTLEPPDEPGDVRVKLDDHLRLRERSLAVVELGGVPAFERRGPDLALE